MNGKTDILWEVEQCARAASRNKVFLNDSFVVENWPRETLVGAADEIRRLRAQVDLLRSRVKELEPSRDQSIADRVRRGLQ